MADIGNLLKASGMAAEVYAITGKTEDSAAAAGFGAWVESVAGSYPSVVKTGTGKASVRLNDGQIVAMQQWLDSQVRSSVSPSTSDSSLSIEFGPVLRPVAVKYVVLILAVGFLGGWFGHRVIKG
jgi:hypothetical protein